MTTTTEIDFDTDDDAHGISFFVPGVPCPGGSKRFMGLSKRTGRAILIDAAGERNTNWKQRVAVFARDAYKGKPLSGPLKVRFQFFMPRLKSHFHTSKKRLGVLREDAPIFHTTKPDTTKLVRSTEDGAKGIPWIDDSQIALQSASKLYSDHPGCQITITQLQ